MKAVSLATALQLLGTTEATLARLCYLGQVRYLPPAPVCTWDHPAEFSFAPDFAFVEEDLVRVLRHQAGTLDSSATLALFDPTSENPQWADDADRTNALILFDKLVTPMDDPARPRPPTRVERLRWLLDRYERTTNALMEAAQEIDGDGPLVHRIRVLKQEHAEANQLQDARIKALKAAALEARGWLQVDADWLENESTDDDADERFLACQDIVDQIDAALDLVGGKVQETEATDATF